MKLSQSETDKGAFSMTKIISLTLTAVVLLGLGYGALIILVRLAELVDTNDWVSASVGIVFVIVFALTLSARK